MDPGDRLAKTRECPDHPPGYDRPVGMRRDL